MDQQLLFFGVSGFAGSIVAVWTGSWWLSSKFGHIYKIMNDHEINDINRFNAMNLKIQDAIIQAQAAQISKLQQPT